MPAPAVVVAYGAGAVFAWNVGVGVAIAAGGAFLSSHIAKDASMERQTPSSPSQSGHQVNTRSSRRPLPVIYGEVTIGVNKTFAHVVNPYLYMICELCEGPISGIVREDGSLYNTTATNLTDTNPPLVYLDDTLFTNYENYSDNIYIEFFDGSASQSVCSTLQSAYGGWDQTLRYTSYLMVRLKFDKNDFNSMPIITSKVQGAEIYNPVTAATAYSNSPPLCSYDYLTRSAQRGGIGIAASRIDTQTLSTAIDYCTAKGWTCDLPVTENVAVSDNLQGILKCFRGELLLSGDYIKTKFRDTNYEPVVMTLTSADVVRRGDNFSSLNISQPDTSKRPNTIRATYLNGAKKSLPDDVVLSDAAAITAEGDVREQQINLHGIKDLTTTLKMCNYFLERLRLNRTVSFVGGSRCMALEPMDLVYLTHDFPGWTDQILRVLTCPINGDGTVNVTLIEENSIFYDDTYNLTSQEWDITDLPGPDDAVPGVINVSNAEETYYHRLRTFTRWKIDFDPPATTTYPWWDYAEIWVKVGSGGTWRYMTKSEQNYQIDPVEEGELYYCKIRSVSIFGKREDFDDATTVSTTIVGETGDPSNLTGIIAIANGDSVSIYGTPLTDPDIEGYEIRLGASWEAGIFISFNKSISLRLNGVRPGTHTFWAAAKNNAGNYSGTPVSATVTVFVPPGYSELATYGSWSWDFTTGSHSNTEHVTKDAQDAMKCSHTSSVLTGTWTSATYDMNAIEKVRVWGDFLSTFESTDTTWAGVFPGSTTWADIDPTGTLSWNEIFQPSAAAQIRATLLHKEGVGDSWTELDFFELQCAEVEARYIAVEVTITDPTLDANLYLYELNMLAYEGPQ